MPKVKQFASSKLRQVVAEYPDIRTVVKILFCKACKICTIKQHLPSAKHIKICESKSQPLRYGNQLGKQVVL